MTGDMSLAQSFRVKIQSSRGQGPFYTSSSYKLHCFRQQHSTYYLDNTYIGIAWIKTHDHHAVASQLSDNRRNTIHIYVCLSSHNINNMAASHRDSSIINSYNLSWENPHYPTMGVTWCFLEQIDAVLDAQMLHEKLQHWNENSSMWTYRTEPEVKHTLQYQCKVYGEGHILYHRDIHTFCIPTRRETGPVEAFQPLCTKVNDVKVFGAPVNHTVIINTMTHKQHENLLYKTLKTECSIILSTQVEGILRNLFLMSFSLHMEKSRCPEKVVWRFWLSYTQAPGHSFT